MKNKNQLIGILADALVKNCDLTELEAIQQKANGGMGLISLFDILDVAIEMKKADIVEDAERVEWELQNEEFVRDVVFCQHGENPKYCDFCNIAKRKATVK